MSTSPSRVSALKSATKVLSSLQGGSGESLSESERVSALAEATKLVAALENPEDASLKFAYMPGAWMAIRTLVDLKVFHMLSEKEAVSVCELATRTGADELLLTRLLRVLVALGYVSENGVGHYGPTKWTMHFSNRLTEGMIKFIYDHTMPCLAATPTWLKDKGYPNPIDPKDSIWQAGHGNCKELTFEWLALPGNESYWDDANSFFEGDRGSRPAWFTWFPVQEKLLDGADVNDDAILMVDVAGGRGHDLLEFHAQYHAQPGRLILQDQQPVLDSITDLPKRIETYGLDFWTQQPVPGARVYFMKFIMHDYADPDCIRILRHVAVSMRKGYSRLVINDFILPDKGSSLLPAQWDLMMMVFLAAFERTASQWRTLLSAAGLEIEGMYYPPGDGQGIIIASLV
ncbi:hypothetical protein PFICI_14399 [Pestalotiopsis fici W106-1]|uniref:Uncharacterized protein n=1 Tax=Pestalotiopsis fici (strain W106-1 / CGMCC3.15140) TaxID=1229662 RepID=W3WHT3_PESFW|nr:uncharacterized protein PFICI_14399 [Pestalotiopsis fici W106-1]ETS73453.1 hypothetical protein PFICI_14399 [Pestalotiopsis fici W106-1]